MTLREARPLLARPIEAIRAWLWEHHWINAGQAFWWDDVCRAVGGPRWVHPLTREQERLKEAHHDAR